MARKKKSILDFANLGTPLASIILRNLPFVMFLGFLATIYIANVHYAENSLREIKQLERQIAELRWQSMAAQAELMYDSKQSEVLKKVKPLGLIDSGKKAKKIVLNNKEKKGS